MSETVERTRSTERAVVETVEDEDYYCPHCTQWFDEDEIVIIGLGLEKEEMDRVPGHRYGYETKDQICATCAENLFGYDGPTGILEEIQYETEHWTWREMLSASTSISIVLLTFGLIIHGLTSLITIPALAEFSTVGSFIIFGILLWLIKTAMVVGPR